MTQYSDFLRSCLQTLSISQKGLAQLFEQARGGHLSEGLVRAVALLLAAKGRVIVTGMGKSGHIARKIAATFASTGTPSHYVHPAEASHGDLGMIQGEDVVLALSWSGETAELANLVDYTRRFQVSLVAITSQAGSSLAQAADVALLLPAVEEACPNGLAPTTSTLLQLAIGDALAVALLEARGFSAQDFRVFHPGGKLGARLKHVRDLMHAGESLPLIPTGALMADALLVMSQKGFGCVGVVDGQQTLLGIITDGDLRRHMGPDLLSQVVDAVMTCKPRVAEPDMLVSEALEKMNSANITALFVVEAGRAVGVLHVHDLLRAGVV